MHVHGGHAWVWMGVGEHNCGLGHGKEAKRVTHDHFQSWGYSENEKKTWFVGEGQECSVEVRPDTQGMF